MDKGYIKLYRQLTHWRYWKNNTAVILWLHILMRAYWQDGEIENVEIPRGSFTTSYKALSDECSIPINQIRYYLHQFDGKEITLKPHNRYTLITVNKWEFFQGQDTPSSTNFVTKVANKPQTDHTQTTPNKEYKEIEEYKEINNTSFSSQKEELGYDPKDYDFGWFNFNTRGE